MSEPKLISPLLDNFAMGDPISSHNGVQCCPAMKTDSDKKYIVKMISVPASQTQLEALLITGAYSSTEDAKQYFLQTVKGIEKDASILAELSKLEGFLPYEGFQSVPMENGVGYNVYLLSEYKRSLEKYFQRNPMTHLGAINLGIDLCSALTECRRAGYLYADLKPSNIFLCGDRGYRIGDLGFISLDSLRYASLPERFRSKWTAPELADPMATLNTTVDIYAVGLILYQAYNNGTLPFENTAPDEPLDPPMYADYELAEIILKACAPKPEDRWQEPSEMGQALVAYMQRNGANDTPIIPPKPAAADNDQPILSEDAQVTEDSQDDSEAAEVSDEDTPSEETEADETPASTDPEGDDALRLIHSLVSDETAPSEEDAAVLADASLTEEGNSILSQADDLIAHETPGPAVAPDPVEIPMPEPIGDEDAKDSEENPSEDSEEAQEEEDVPELTEEEAEHKRQLREKAKKIVKRVSIAVLIVVLAAALATGGWYGYKEYYLQDVSKVELKGFEDTLTVNVDSEADESKLFVRLIDTFGNTREAKVVDGAAKFSNLEASSQFTVQVEIEGLHKLRGKTTFAYATQARTSIVSFTAKAGSEDGSAILNFTVDGPDIDEWTVAYGTEGEEEKQVSFSGHMVTIEGLNVGSKYLFRLVPTDEIYLVGEDQLEYTAAKVFQAENLAVTDYSNNTLTATWAAPADTTVKSWTVHCYNDSGYDQTQTTSESSFTFKDIDSNKAYTIEVTAEGMTLSARTYVTANPLTVTEIHGNDKDPKAFTFNWEFTGTAPEGGWLLMYTVDGSKDQKIVQCDEASAVVAPKIPGSKYTFTLQAANGSTVFCAPFTATVPEAETFQNYGASAENMTFRMCKTPDVEDWSHYDLSEDDYKTKFAVGEKASFSIWNSREYNVSYDDVVTLFVIRDEKGTPVLFDTDVRPWVDMWLEGYCELNVPNMPSKPGTYTMQIYFDGAFAAKQEFTVVE